VKSPKHKNNHRNADCSANQSRRRQF